MKKKLSEAEIVQMSIDLKMHELEACILGTTGFVCNRVSQKSVRELLFPKGRKTAADKATSLKHDPMAEFQASPYISCNFSRNFSPVAEFQGSVAESLPSQTKTLIEMPAVSFKKAIESIALDVPGATKAQISRNIVAPDNRIPVYGVPQMFMAVVRSADQARTPDVRTRAIIPQWATRVRIRYPHPIFREKVVADYLALAGQLRGVGDGRAERGALSFGLFEIVDPDDPRYLAIVQTGGREAQIAAMAAPEMFDDETEELFSWFQEERLRRGTEQPKKTKNGTAAAEVEAEVQPS